MTQIMTWIQRCCFRSKSERSYQNYCEAQYQYYYPFRKTTLPPKVMESLCLIYFKVPHDCNFRMRRDWSETGILVIMLKANGRSMINIYKGETSPVQGSKDMS